ncbi:MAG TPA: YfhO family protein [Bryobacteraceae bacterium]|nr:YfhO family protein [Bryobacteraceae bacterium]
MERAFRLRTVGLLSLIFTYVFFLNYLPPFKRVHIPFDLEGYHYPLVNYAFQALREGRFPEWDAAQYCGISLVGNTQVALFYPPLWIIFAANAGREALSYQSLQDLVLAHVWLAFMLCYGWLRYKRLAELPSALGAGVFAFSGYMMLQLQHLGLVIGYAWMPLGLWSIDQATEEQSWRPLWKLTLGSAMCFLGGYTPTWLVFAVCMLAYAAWRWKALLGTALALAASLAIAMVQILPTMEALSLKAPEMKYGSGVNAPGYYLSYLAPNYFDFGLHVPVGANPGRDYVYLGAPGLFGLLYLLRRRGWRDVGPLLALLAATAFVATNPFGIVSQVIGHSTLLSQLVRDWYFLAGLTLAAAPLAALGLNDYLRQTRPPGRVWVAYITLVLLGGWSVRGLIIARPAGPGPPAGLGSVMEAAVMLVLFALAVYVLRAQRGVLRTYLAASLLATVAVDYHIHGTSKRFNAVGGQVSGALARNSFVGIDDAVYRQVRAQPHYRVAVDRHPFPYELRLHGMRTPQGFDPLLTVPYRKLIDSLGSFQTDRDFDIDSANRDGLRLLGVRYFVTYERAPQYSRLSNDPAFRLLEPSQSYYKVFEFQNARPSYGWVDQDLNRSARVTGWSPERRAFIVRSDTGGRFGLSEQFFPGWHATIDGIPARIERWSGVFQAIRVPPGEHRVEFDFRSRGLRVGATVSLAALIGLWCLVRRSRRGTAKRSRLAEYAAG